MLTRYFNTIRSNFFTISVLVVLYFGWLNRDSNYLSAESGTGYTLGIVGGSLMLVLLLYPLSKRVATLTHFIPTRYWFGIHMLFGTLGPVLVLFHSNFHLGSANSSIALICMLLVAGSGVIGRYFYTRIHRGLYGARLTLKELKQQTEEEHEDLLKLYTTDEKLNKRLNKMEEKALQPYTGILKGFAHVIYMAAASYRFKRRVLRLLKNSSQKDDTNVAKNEIDAAAFSVNRYLLVLRKTASFKVYERFFSLWHIFHLPLFFMMIITAIIHIFAVHLY